jgi:hypothetical protein
MKNGVFLRKNTPFFDIFGRFWQNMVFFVPLT